MTGSRFSEIGRMGGLIALATFLCSCSSPQKAFEGLWVSEQASAVTLELYPDGSATLSSVNVLDLKWQVVERKWARIDGLRNTVSFNFRLTDTGGTIRGTLQAAGYDTLTFRKSP